MDVEIKEKENRRHVGRNLQRIRVYLGMKQEALAADLGVNQQVISKIEKQEEIEEGFLKRIAEVLGISEEVIKDFDVEKTIFNINHHNYKDANISEGATTYAIVQQINPLEKIVELYERLLKSEQDKIEILKKYMKPLYRSLGVYLPLITTNCAVLGVALNCVTYDYNLLEGVVYGFSTAFGFFIAIVLMAGIREKIEYNDIPKTFRGTAIVLITACLMSIAFMGFSGMI